MDVEYQTKTVAYVCATMGFKYLATENLLQFRTPLYFNNYLIIMLHMCNTGLNGV